MRAWRLMKHGAPARALALQDVPAPTPAPGEVLIASEGFGLNYADVMAVKGLYRDAPPVPCVLGYETVGRVTAVGDGVPAALLHQRVVAMTRFGGYAEQAVTDHRALAVIDDGVPLGEALALATQGCTAWYMAMVARPLRPGQRVLVHSAAGGVGLLLVQLALHQGCEVFSVASGAEKRERLRALGVQHVIDRQAGNIHERLQHLLGREQLDAAFNAVGGTTFKRDLALIGSGGALVLFGGSERGGGRSGLLGTLAFVWRMGLVVPIFLMMRSRSLIGVNMLRISEQKPELIAECLCEVVRARNEGWLRPHVHHTYPSSELPAALAALAGGRTSGKVAVRWDG
ncbi:MAG: zinc-binding dehydrogenase [Flavobacteriales bacterium]